MKTMSAYHETKEKIRLIALSFGAVIATSGIGKRKGRRTLAIEGIHCPAMNWTCCDLPAMMIDKIMEDFGRYDFGYEDLTDKERNKWRVAIKRHENRLKGLNREVDEEIYQQELEDIKESIAYCKACVEEGVPAHYYRDMRANGMREKVVEAVRKYNESLRPAGYDHEFFHYETDDHDLHTFVTEILKPRVRWEIRLILPVELSV